MLFKTIISGRLQFHSPRSFRNALDLFIHRGEVYYKNDIALKPEDIFDEEAMALVIPRHICQLSEKTWKSTINLLEYTAQFALSGAIEAWMIEEGKALEHTFIEPRGDKQAIQDFMTGRELMVEEESPSEAIAYFTRAIQRFAKHAPAYLYRGEAHLELGNLAEAKADFEKGIECDEMISAAFLGLGKVAMAKKDWKAATGYFQQATRHSIPMQPKYWVARRLKGESHLELEEYEKASVEFKFFTNRGFEKGDPNRLDLKRACFDYGRSLMALGKYEQAISALSESAAFEEECGDTVSDDEVLILRGLARQKAGKEDFETDWKKAAKGGSARARKLLEEAVV